MRKMFLALSVALAMVLSGCKDVMLNGNMREYLEFYTTTALLSKHDVQTESYTDQAGNLTVPSHQDAVVNLYTSNPKSFTLIPQFTATFSNGATLDSELDSYGLTVKQHPSDLTRYTATIPSKLLEELDLKGSGITLTVTPMEVVSQRTMPEYTFTLRSNTKPAFGGAAAVIMQTSDAVDGSKKWVLCFELPDLSGIHKDIVTVEINGRKYAVDASAGQGAAALASMGSKLTTTDKIQVKDGGGVFFRPDVSDNGVYFITDDTIGTAKTYTVRLVDSAGLAATLPPVSTADTVYGKEIVSFVFEASKNPQIASLGNGDLTGTISGTYISFNAPAALTDKRLTPTITLSGGTVNPAGDTPQDFSQPVTYTVTAGDGTTRAYTVSLGQFLPKPELDKTPGHHTIDAVSMTVKPTNGLPSGTLLHYTVNGGQEQTADPTQGIQLPAAVDTPYEIDCWFQCEGYEPSNHLTGTYNVELSPVVVTASIRSKDTSAQANETTVDGSQTTTLTHNFDGLQGSAVTFASTASGVTLKVDDQDSAASYDIAPGETKSYTVTAYNQQGTQAARPVVFTITSSRRLPKPRLTPSVEPVGSTYTLHYPATELTMTVDNTGLPSGTVLSYDLNGQQNTLNLSQQTSFTIPVGSGCTLSYRLTCTTYEDSETTSISSFTVESRLPTPQLTPSVAASGNKYTVDYPTQALTMTLPDASNFPPGTQLKYMNNGQEVVLPVTNGTFSLAKNTYTDFTYWYECSGFTSSETARLGTFTVESKLPTPVLSVSGSSSSSGTTYYTTTGSVTVKASNTTTGTVIPAGAKLKYKIGSGTEQSTDPSTGFTLDIQGSAYSVTAWYECSGYESSATTTQSYTVWLHKSKIVLTATSRSAHTDGMQTANGSSPSLTHNFYGVTGSSFSFSAGDSTVKKADGSSYSFSTSGSTFTLAHNSTISKSVYATLGGQQVSDSVSFSAISIMRPITFTFGGQGRIGVQIWWENKTYTQQPIGWTRVNGSDLWNYTAENWTLPEKNNRDIHTVTSALTEQTVTVNAPADVLAFSGWMRETAGSDVDYATVNNTVTAESLYSNRSAEWPHKLESNNEYTYYYKFNYQQ